VIATPASLHVEQAIELGARGSHLLIEKPLSVDLDRVPDLRRIAREKSIVVGLAYVYRAHPVLSEMREAIGSGEFGRPLQLVAVSGQNFPFCRPAYRDTYYSRRQTGGGAVQDALTHTINACQWILGDIDRLVADMDHLAIAGVDVEDTVHVLARHGDVLASYSLNQHQAPNEMTITIVCERGTVRFEGHQQHWLAMKSPGDAWTERGKASIQRDDLFIRQANAFLDCVEGKQEPLCPLDEGIATLRANLAILRSGDCGAWVKPSEI
jgi:predicted dehydrogenase